VRYTVTIDGRTFVVDVEGDAVRLDGTPLHARLHALPQSPLRQLVLGGTARTFAFLPADGGWTVLDRGEAWCVTVTDERTARLQALTAPGGGHESAGSIRAPMPGLVVRVEVEPGQRVEAGQGVVVLEAMKMENEIRATAPGIVAAVPVAAGQVVEKGAVLVHLTGAGSVDLPAGSRHEG
jgi:pyruvate carboxylase subunit B